MAKELTADSVCHDAIATLIGWQRFRSGAATCMQHVQTCVSRCSCRCSSFDRDIPLQRFTHLLV